MKTLRKDDNTGFVNFFRRLWRMNLLLKNKIPNLEVCDSDGRCVRLVKYSGVIPAFSPPSPISWTSVGGEPPYSYVISELEGVCGLRSGEPASRSSTPSC